MSRRLAAAGVLLCGAVLAATQAGVLPLPTVPATPPHTASVRVPGGPARAGSWFCPAAPDGAGAAVLTLAASGDGPSTVSLPADRWVAQADADASRVERIREGRQARVTVRADAARRPLALGWRGGQVAAGWRAEGRDPATATCEAAVRRTWYFAGLATAYGSEATLHLTNPLPADAVARLSFATADGPVRLVGTDDVTVGGGQSRAVDLTRLVPEQADLGARVEVRTGRLLAWAQLQRRGLADRPLVPAEQAGSDLLAAVPAPALRWDFAGVPGDPHTSSWLSLYNPSRAPAAVAVAYSDAATATQNPDSARASTTAEEVAVAAGGTTRIELRDVSRRREFGVTVRSLNGVRIVATRVSTRLVEGPGVLKRASGLTLQTSAGVQPSAGWTLPPARPGERYTLYNPSPEPADVALGAPRARLRLGGMATVAVAARRWSGDAVRLTADRPIVAALLGPPGVDTALLGASGVAEDQWRVPEWSVFHDARLRSSARD